MLVGVRGPVEQGVARTSLLVRAHDDKVIETVTDVEPQGGDFLTQDGPTILLPFLCSMTGVS